MGVFVVAAMLAAPALAQSSLPTFEWSRVTTPDGRASAEIPCRADLVKLEEIGGGGYKIDCQTDGHRFIMISGFSSITESDKGRINDFDTLHARVLSGPLASRARLTTIGNHRAMTVGCDLPDSFVCMTIVDQVPGRPLAIGYGADGDAFGALSPEGKIRVTDSVQKFVQSLELHDK
jgi:hypothetical protein